MQTRVEKKSPRGRDTAGLRGEAKISASDSKKETFPALNGDSELETAQAGGFDEKHPHFRKRERTKAGMSGTLVEHLDVATVLKVSQAVSGEITLEKVVEVLLRTAIEYAGAERALLILPRGSELWIHAEARTRGDSVTVLPGDAPLSSLELPESVVRYAARTRETVILDDASARNQYSSDKYICRQHPRSVLCMPLTKQSTLVALLYLENNLGPNIFTPPRITVLNVLASAAAISLDNSRLYRELQEREGRIRRLVDANIIGVLISDSEGRIIESNDAFLKMVGYNRDELVSGRMRWRDMTPAEWKEPSENGVAQVKATGACKVFEKEYCRKDGSRVPVLVGAARFEKNSTVAFAIDLTERKHAEEALRRSTQELQRREAYLAEAQRLSHTGSFGWDVLTGQEFWSEETYRICGYDFSIKPSFQLILDRVHRDDIRLWQETFGRAADGREVDFEHRLVMPDGLVKYLHVVAYGAQKGGRFVELIGTMRDITERKRVEEVVQRSEAFLAEGQRLSHTGSWAWNASTGKVTWSQEHFRILGLDSQDTRPSLNAFWERVHPDDRASLQRTFEFAIKQKKDFDQEFRIVRPDSSVRHLHGVWHAILDQTNELVEFIGSTMDITQRKRAEERAQSQREAIRLALNAFIEELDVDRFLRDVITELNNQLHAKSWELWLFDEAFKELSLHLSNHSADSQNGRAGDKNIRHIEEIKSIWQSKSITRVPVVFQLRAQKSMLDPKYSELLSAQGVKTLLIVPLALGEQNLGFLELRFQSSMQFTSDDLELAQALANHATLALQLNRLTRRAGQLAVTEERNRLAREIHDTLAQAFAGIVLHSEALGTSLGTSKRRSVKSLSRIRKLARSGLDEARRSVQALRPKALEGSTLPEALRLVAKRLDEGGKFSCIFRQRGQTQCLSSEAQDELFRIAQEALTNVTKHARAKSVSINLTFTTRQVSLSIRDNGVGLMEMTAAGPHRGYGLGTMRERSQRIGGKLEIERPERGGTSVRVRVPLAKTFNSINQP